MGNTGIRHPVIQWLPFAMILCLPAVALAQVSVQYQTLTLVESAYLYSGLALQSVLRLSSLCQLPQAIMACGVVWLLYRRLTTSHPQPFAGIVAYVISCSVILVLFWPEAAPRFFSPLTTRVFPGAVTSYVAQRNVMAVDNAGASRLVPASLQTAGGAPVPRFTDLLLRVVTTVPLTLGETIDSQGLARPFERIPALHELMKQDVPPALTAMMPEFVNHCYNPAAVQAADDPGLAFETVVPWGSIMSTELARLTLPTERGLVLTLKKWLPALFSAPTANCRSFYDGMEADVSSFLAGEATQQGSNKRQQYQNVLGLQAQSQARFLVQRELEKHLESDVQAPERVTRLRRKVDAASFAAGALGNFDLTAPGKSTTGQIQKQLDRLSGFLGVGSFLVYWAPYVVGTAMFATLSFFPIVLLWSLFPGQHFKPIVNYFLLLVFVCSTPLWWAMVNVAADLAHERYSPAGNWLAALPGSIHAELAYVVLTIIGIVMVPVIQAVLLFGTWRAIGGIWHA